MFIVSVHALDSSSCLRKFQFLHRPNNIKFGLSAYRSRVIMDSEQEIHPEDKVIRDKMKEMFANIITDIDKQVLTVGQSQSELDSQLDKLMAALESIRIDEKLTDDISANTKRILSLKNRLTLIHTILSNASDRCSKTLAACGSAISSINASARD